MRELLERESSGDRRAALAVEMFVDRAAAAIAAAMTRLGILDALVFTGGIGENAAPIRARICTRLAVIGIPEIADGDDEGDTNLAPDGAPAVLRIFAREDIVIARAVERLATR